MTKYDYNTTIAHYKQGYKYIVLLYTYTMGKGWNIDTIGYFKNKEEADNIMNIMKKAFENNRNISKYHWHVETLIIEENHHKKVIIRKDIDIQNIVNKYFNEYNGN